MRQRALILIVLMTAAVTTSGCAAGMKEMINQQNTTIQEMQAQLDQVVQQGGVKTEDLDAIRGDISQIGARLAGTEDTISELSRKTDNVSTRVSLLTDEVTRLKMEPPVSNPPVSDRVVLFGEPPSTAPGTVQAIYNNALRLYEADRPREAIAEWSRVLEAAPTSDLADNAEYWIGECYYKLEEFEPALAAFQRVFNHEGANKYEDAQLKIGMTYRLMGRRTEAIAALRELINRYPTSEHVGLARQIIAEIGG
ncbi:tetratricopeptide repeat protein [Gemmatimonadota bacterium]